MGGFVVAGEVIAINISQTKGTKKVNVGEAYLQEERGLADDAHAGPGHRQVSLLALESIEKIRRKGLAVSPGDFAENITTGGIELNKLPVGTRFSVGSEVLLVMTQLGKECLNPCAIFHQVGTCVMPIEGIFARVIQGGLIRVGDPIRIEESERGQGSPRGDCE